MNDIGTVDRGVLLDERGTLRACQPTRRPNRRHVVQDDEHASGGIHARNRT
jgi:hypothetical protein